MATYTYRFTEAYGSYINLIADRDLENEVFEVGDVINFTGNIYNAGGNGGGTFTRLSVGFARSASTSVSKGNITINAPVKKTTSFSATPIKCTIAVSDCVVNSIVGGVAKVQMHLSADSSSTSQTFKFVNNAIRIQINDPTVAPAYNISDEDINESVNYKDRFGAFIQSVSQTTISISVSSIDTGTGNNLSGSVTSASLSVIAPDGSEIYANTIKNPKSTAILEYELGSFNESGVYTCALALTGSYGKTGTYSTTFTVLPYTMPKLFINGTNPIAKRFRAEQDDAGGTIYTEAPDGRIALLSFAGGIQAFGGLNTYDISVGYGIEGEGTIITHFASGTDADSIVFAYQDTIELLKNVTFSADNRYQFDVTITDYFGQSATITGYVDKAIFRFRITENGVSVGMNSTATAEEKKFESAYPAYMYGGIAGVTNYPAAGVEELTGGTWIDGKQIYRIAFQGNATTSTNGVVVGTITNLDFPIRMYGFLRRSSGAICPVNYWNASNNQCNTLIDNSGEGVLVRSSHAGSVVVVVEYTKK